MEKRINLKLQKIYHAKLVPLNKKYPDIPRAEEFRPIAIISHMYKWIELRFINKIQNYFSEIMSKR